MAGVLISYFRPKSQTVFTQRNFLRYVFGSRQKLNYMVNHACIATVWSYLTGWFGVCVPAVVLMLSFPRTGSRLSDRSFMLTPTWSTSTRWDPTTTSSDLIWQGRTPFNGKFSDVHPLIFTSHAAKVPELR